MSHELLLQLALSLGTAAAVYGGIRADLKHHAEGITHAKESAQRAHERLDTHIEHAHGR